jgi:predicted nucleotidyltransferase
MKAREGDLLESRARVVFDVKGLVHPQDRVIAFVRYFPDEKGERKRNGVAYGKVYSLSKRYTLLKERFPQYLVYDPVFDEMLCEVPVSDVKKHYKPVSRVQGLRSSRCLDGLESRAIELVELLKEEANIPWKAIGLSGSIMAGLHTANSDIDPIVYGFVNCGKVYSALKGILREKLVGPKPYTREELRILYEFRSKDTAASFEDFVRTESRKVLQGKFLGTDYFVRFVKDWNEIGENYGDVQYKNAGYARIRATVADDSQSIFTPCTYRIENVRVVEGPNIQPITEIASFRGRFCEQARTGEAVIAQGKIERVIDRRQNREYFRILLGNKPSDLMILE